MDNFRHCPICLEVLEREIYQCSEGHIICHLCISKLPGDLCPQCRLPLEFGNKKIRCRALEEILDSHDFECEFNDEGCTQLIKRGEVTSHANCCVFNPAIVQLCWELGLSCSFHLGCISRAETIAHFENQHHYPFLRFGNRGTWFKFAAGCEITHEFGRRNVGPRFANSVTFSKTALCSNDDGETSPVFLVRMLINHSIQFVSAICVKVWESKSLPSRNHVATFRFVKATSNPPAGAQQSSSSSGVSVENRFPISVSEMVVSSLKKYSDEYLEHQFKIITDSGVLEDSRFGDNLEDCVEVKIT